MAVNQPLTRDEKAQRILDSRGVRPIHPQAGIYAVESESSARTYRVDLQLGSCECEDHVRGNICKHRRAATLYSTQPKPAMISTAPRTLDAYIQWAFS